MRCDCGSTLLHYGGEFYCSDCDFRASLHDVGILLDEAKKDILRLRKHIEYVEEINRSVAVCEKHKSEITQHEGCLVCDNEKMKETLNALRDRIGSECCKSPMALDGESCLQYVGCGRPCEKPCKKCLVWNGYGVAGDKK